MSNKEPSQEKLQIKKQYEEAKTKYQKAKEHVKHMILVQKGARENLNKAQFEERKTWEIMFRLKQKLDSMK